MSNLIKVEIRLITEDGHPGDWQWMGKISKDNLKALCSVADTLSDIDTERELKEPHSYGGGE